jgi:hypothetical protein
VVGPASFLVDGKDDTAWGADRGPGRRHQDLAVHLRIEKPVSYAEGTRFKVTLRFQHSGSDAHGRTNNFLGRFRLSIADSDTALQPLPYSVTDALNTPTDRRSEQQTEALFNFWRETDLSLSKANAAINKVWSGYPEGETLLNLTARKPEHHRQTAILERGNWQKPTIVVTPGVPAALHALPQDAPPNRLTLARWLVDRRSPTTARVAVEDGTKFFFDGRTMIGARNDMSSVVHGAKGSGIVSTSGHFPGKCRIFKDQHQEKASVAWAYPQPEQSPYTLEWKDLLDAITQDKPHNEVPRAVQACLVSNMGRMAAHTAQEITFEQIVNCPHEMAPGVAEFTMKGPAPVMPNADGKYPVPIPGVITDREYGEKA